MNPLARRETLLFVGLAVLVALVFACCSAAAGPVAVHSDMLIWGYGAPSSCAVVE